MPVLTAKEDVNYLNSRREKAMIEFLELSHHFTAGFRLVKRIKMEAWGGKRSSLVLQSAS